MPFIPLEVFANNPSTTIANNGYQGGTSTADAPATGTVETWTFMSLTGFPMVEIGATQFHIADPAAPSEPITVMNTSGATATVMRGAEGSTPVTHAAGATFVQVVTAGALAGMQYPAWQFPVQAYGAQGDGKIGTGGTGASGQNVFTDAGASFVNATAPAGDVGKVIIINQGTGSATAPTNPFVGTISAVNSSTSVTLNANLAATCTAAPYVYGTDDAAAITAVVLAAAQWAVSTGNYKAQVIFEPQLYMLGALVQSTTYGFSPFNTGVNYTYNTHIPVPFTTQYARKLVLDFVGVGDASEPDFWGSAIPSVQGTCLVSAVSAASQPNATFGQQSVVGTPSAQTNIGNGGITGGNFANVLVNIDGIAVVTPYNAQQYSFDFRYAAQLNVPNGAALAFNPINVGAQTVGGTWLRATSIPNNGVAVALAMPTIGNNDNCNVGEFSVEGIAFGIIPSEHFNAFRYANLYCHAGILLTAGVSSPASHGGSIQYWSCEGSDYGILTQGGSGTQYTLDILNADFEVINTEYISDAGNTLGGTMYWDDLIWSPIAGPGISGAFHYQVINTRFYPGIWAANAGLSIPAPPAAPASATAQQNTSYRPATVYATATTSITAFAVGPTSGTLVSVTASAGAGVGMPIRVPSGWWYSVTYTGTLVTTWMLD